MFQSKELDVPGLSGYKVIPCPNGWESLSRNDPQLMFNVHIKMGRVTKLPASEIFSLIMNTISTSGEVEKFLISNYSRIGIVSYSIHPPMNINQLIEDFLLYLDSQPCGVEVSLVIPFPRFFFFQKLKDVL